MAGAGSDVQLFALTGNRAERKIGGKRKEETDTNCYSKRLLEGRTFFLLRRRSQGALRAALAFLALSASSVFAERCQTANEMEDATRTALTAAALRDFALIARGDAASLRQSAIPSLAADFSGIEARIKENQPALAASKAAARPPSLLIAEGTAALPRAEFFCGVFGSKGQTRDSAIFTLNTLPPGQYAVAILDAP